MKLVARALAPVALLVYLPLGCSSTPSPAPVTGATAGAGGVAGAGVAAASSAGSPAQAGALGNAGTVGNGGGSVGAGGSGAQSGVPTSAGAAGSSNGGSGGAAGAAGAAGSAGAAGTVGSCAGVLCEDFETGQVDPAKWSTPVIGGATMMVETTNVAHGKYAVQFHGPANPSASDYVYIIAKNAPAALAKHNFGRAYMYISLQRNDIDMGMIFGGTAGFPKPTYMSIANHSTGYQLGFIKLSGSPGGEVQAYPKGDMPVMKWSCVEWELNDQPDEINLWVDSKVIGSLNNMTVAYPGGKTPGTPLYNNMDSGLIGAFTDFGFGFYDWHSAGRPAFDLYYDDIVLNTARVGCLQ
ncbi:MAG TPA: hypothetical protein VGL19_00195 [Polyangiaceae bacterium]